MIHHTKLTYEQSCLKCAMHAIHQQRHWTCQKCSIHANIHQQSLDLSEVYYTCQHSTTGAWTCLKSAIHANINQQWPGLV